MNAFVNSVGKNKQNNNKKTVGNIAFDQRKKKGTHVTSRLITCQLVSEGTDTELGPVYRGPAHVSMERLLRMVPESSVYHVPRDATPRHPLWAALAHDIARDTG